PLLARKPFDVAALAAAVADADEDEVSVRVTVPCGPVLTTVSAEVCAAEVDEVPAEDVAVADEDEDDEVALDDEELLDRVDATVLVVEVAVEVAVDLRGA
ncbi:hypothetical protein EVJ58_g2649, partial [Rhodofomes roseus]